MKITDAHIHIFSEVNGENLNGPVKGCGLGKVMNAGEESPFTVPYSEETAYPVSFLLETMKQNQVSKAVLFQNPTIGSVNNEVGEAIVHYPEQLAGVLQVDPFSNNAAREAALLAQEYPFSAIKLEVSTGWGWTGIHKGMAFHYGMIDPLAEVAREYHLAIVFDTGDTNSAAYIPEELGSFATRNSDIRIVIEHGGYLTPSGDRMRYDQMTDLIRLPNVWFGICAIPTLLESEYPCTDALELIKGLYQKGGAEKLLWGTDAPTTLKNYTYRQLIDYVLKKCDFMSQDELQKVFYENAEMLYFAHR